MAWAENTRPRKPVFGKIVAGQQDGTRDPTTLPRVRSWCRLRHFLLRPGWKNLPLATLVVFAAGALPGPPAVLFYGWLLDVHWDHVLKNPHMILVYASLGGACHAVGMYLFCILPLEYLWPRLRSRSRAVRYAAIVGFGLLGASSATFTSFKRLSDFLKGAHWFAASPPTSRLTVFSLVVAISTSFLIVLWRTIITEARLREQALAEAAALAQAQALQTQINPHFFFNTLTTISALADLDGRAARELVSQLADLFRFTISCSQFELVSLEHELEFVAGYLRIEHARFRGRLRFDLPAAHTGRGVLLPGLTLQPIVENAVCHGIAKRREGGLIKIHLDRTESVCVVSVANQVARSEGILPLRPEIVFQPGHSLSNTRERLELAFHGRASLEVVMDETEWIRVVAKVPIIEAVR